MNGIEYYYDSKANTTMYKCNICEEWYYADEVILLDYNGCCTRDIDIVKTIHCHMCNDNN